MSAAKIMQKNKKVAFEDGERSSRESRSRSRTKQRDRRAKSQDVRSLTKENEPKKRDRSLVALVRTGSRKSVSSLVKLFEVGRTFYMTEGRKSQIVLPDERRLEILIQPKLYAHELLDIVSSHFQLKEKEYFGLAFQDETGHYNWLQADKKILEHDLPRKQGTNLTLFFLVRFYVEGITQLQDTATVELFYLNAKQAVFKGQIECDSETVFELAAHVLQTTYGDSVDDATTKNDLKKLPLIPTSALKEHPSIQYCEDRVISYYRKLAGTDRGLAIVNYMTIVERLPTYGIHYYEVKDKKDIPWWLGISHKGIGVYDKNDKSVPRRVFVWKSLENLYYRDKKFSIEVHDPKRIVHTLSSFNLYEDAVREPLYEFDELSDAITDPSTQVSVSRRTFGPGNVNVHAWFGATPQLTKCIWSMAVAQHQFYHERKNSRVNLHTVRSVSEIASELSRSTTSLPGSTGSDISRSGSSASLPSLGASRFDLNFDPADTSKVQREMYQALKARRDALEDMVRKRTEELKLLCIKEGELTGVLPRETPLVPGEEPPQIRRRLGTAFSLDSKLIDGENDAEDRAKKLELEVELQKQITSAALKLASDKSVSRFVRKQRRHSFVKAQGKLKEMEKKLTEARNTGGHKGPARSYDGMYHISHADDDSDIVSPAQSPLVPRGPRSNYKQHDGRSEDSPIHRPADSPIQHHRESPVHRRGGSPVHHPVESPVHRRGGSPVHHPVESPVHRSRDRSPAHRLPESPIIRSATAPKELSQTPRDMPQPSIPSSNSIPAVEAGYTTNSVYATRTQYRNQTYPTLTSRSVSTGSNQSDYDNTRVGNRLETSQTRLEGSRDSGFSSTNNMYNVASRRTSQYVSNNDVSSPSDSHYQTLDTVLGDTAKLHSQHGSLDSSYRRSQRNYGSLERNVKKRNDRNYGRKLSDSDASHSEFSDTPSKFGSKQTSRSEYDLSSKGKDYPSSSRSSESNAIPRGYDNVPPPLPRRNSSRENMIELPVSHESHSQHGHNSNQRKDSRTSWQETFMPEPSPIIQSPTRVHNDLRDGGSVSSDVAQSGDSYSPRLYEGSKKTPTHQVYQNKSTPYTEHSISIKRVESPHTIAPKPMSSKIVTSVKMSPHVEVSKPFEMSDFYKYSEKLRRQRLVEQYHQALMGSRCSTPSQHSTDSGGSGSTSYRSHQVSSSPARGHGHFRSDNSSPYGSPVPSRHGQAAHHPSHSRGPEPSPGIPSNRSNLVTSSYQTVKEHGISTTTSKVQYTVQTQSGQVLYKAQHQTSKHNYYQPPAPMKCDPVRDAGNRRGGGGDAAQGARNSPRHQRQYSTPERSLQQDRSHQQSPMNLSFHLSPPGTLSKAFSNEMLEWYDNEGNQSATEV